jgi:hypothetical protein
MYLRRPPPPWSFSVQLPAPPTSRQCCWQRLHRRHYMEAQHGGGPEHATSQWAAVVAHVLSPLPPGTLGSSARTRQVSAPAHVPWGSNLSG